MDKTVLACVKTLVGLVLNVWRPYGKVKIASMDDKIATMDDKIATMDDKTASPF